MDTDPIAEMKAIFAAKKQETGQSYRQIGAQLGVKHQTVANYHDEKMRLTLEGLDLGLVAALIVHYRLLLAEMPEPIADRLRTHRDVVLQLSACFTAVDAA